MIRAASEALALRLVRDDRVPGLERYILLQEGERFMRVPPEVTQCVAFICSKQDVDTVEGTIFFVKFPDPDLGNREWVFGVTATHVLRLHRRPLDRSKRPFLDRAHIRMNRVGGGALWCSTRPADDWRHHPHTDVSVLPFVIPPDADCVPFPVREQLSDDLIREFNLGPGDPTFLAGLFTKRPGSGRNLPIVRIGTLAAMQDEAEPIDTQDGSFPAYLIETHSVSGLSGSPVFLDMRGDRALPEYSAHGVAVHGYGKVAKAWRFYLLGVLYGHYQDVLKPRGDKNKRSINVGIALAITAEAIIYLIRSPELTARRRAEVERAAKAKRAEIAADGGRLERPQGRPGASRPAP